LKREDSSIKHEKTKKKGKEEKTLPASEEGQNFAKGKNACETAWEGPKRAKDNQGGGGGGKGGQGGGASWNPQRRIQNRVYVTRKWFEPPRPPMRKESRWGGSGLIRVRKRKGRPRQTATPGGGRSRKKEERKKCGVKVGHVNPSKSVQNQSENLTRVCRAKRGESSTPERDHE